MLASISLKLENIICAFISFGLDPACFYYKFWILTVLDLNLCSATYYLRGLGTYFDVPKVPFPYDVQWG